MTTYQDIRTEVWLIHQKRRDEVHRVMAAYDREVYHPELRRQREACKSIGHCWRFTNVGPLGDPWFSCSVCGATECRTEKGKEGGTYEQVT